MKCLQFKNPINETKKSINMFIINTFDKIGEIIHEIGKLKERNLQNEEKSQESLKIESKEKH